MAARVAGGGVSGRTGSQLTSAAAWVDERAFSIYLRTRLALTPWARATAATDAPSTKHSATIAAFSSGLRRTYLRNAMAHGVRSRNDETARLLADEKTLLQKLQDLRKSLFR